MPLKIKDSEKFSVTHSKSSTFLVEIKAGAESPPQAYDRGYVMLPLVDAKFVRVTRRGSEVVNQEEVIHKARVPFWVDPPPPGHTYSLKNNGQGVGLFEKKLPHDGTEPTEKIRLGFTDALTIKSADGKIERAGLMVHVATEKVGWQTGFKYQAEGDIGKNHGILMDWGKVITQDMTLLHVGFDVDFAFVGDDGVVKGVALNQKAGTDTVSSPKDVRAVIEAKGGSLTNVKEGDIVIHSLFK